MTIDVNRLRDFYSAAPRIVPRRLINRGIHARWPNGRTGVLALVIPRPIWGLFAKTQSAASLHAGGAGRAEMADRAGRRWPPPTLVDNFRCRCGCRCRRILLDSSLEMSDDPRGLLREVWRVRAPSGRMMAVVRTAGGCDAHRHHAVRHGRPYSRSQITQLLRPDLVTPTRGRGAVHAAGSGRRFLRSAMAWKRASAPRCRCRSPAFTSWKPQAGVPPDPGAPRTRAAYSGAAAGAGAVAPATR